MMSNQVFLSGMEKAIPNQSVFSPSSLPCVLYLPTYYFYKLLNITFMMFNIPICCEVRLVENITGLTLYPYTKPFQLWTVFQFNELLQRPRIAGKKSLSCTGVELFCYKCHIVNLCRIFQYLAHTSYLPIKSQHFINI